MTDLVILGHTGLGDCIAMNGLVRTLAASHQIQWLCNSVYHESIKFMLRDTSIKIVSVKDEPGAIEAAQHAQDNGLRVLKLGYFAGSKFNDTWDKIFYRDAQVPWEHKQSRWKLERNREREWAIPVSPYAFVHDDPLRGMVIQRDLIREIPLLFSYQFHTTNIFDYCALIENAREIHAINSSFAVLADLMGVRANRLILHRYPRPDGSEPCWIKPWEFITTPP